MTLEELQIVITTNVAPAMQQLKQMQSSVYSMAKTAADAGKQASNAVEKATSTTTKALEADNAAQKKSVEALKDSYQKKAQTMDDFAALAERAIKRQQDSLKGSNGGPLYEPVALKGGSGSALADDKKQARVQVPQEETDSSPKNLNALQRLRAEALKARQAFSGMMSASKASSESAGSAISLMNSKLEIANAKIDAERKKLNALQAEYGKAVGKSGTKSPEAEKLQEQILNTRGKLVSLRTEAAKTTEQIRKMNASLHETGSAGNKSASGAEKAARGFLAASGGSSAFRRELSMMGRQIISMIFIYGLLMRALTTLGTYMWSALKTNTAFSNSLNNLKVQFLTAFNPIYQAALPALTSLINAMARAMSYIAAFVSGFFGKTYAQSERSAAGLNKNVKALDATGAAAKKAAQAAKDASAGFDELNVIKPTEVNTDKPDTGKDAALANTDFGAASAKPLISPEQIQSAEAAGEKVRAIFERIHSTVKTYEQPIKAAVLGIITSFLLFKAITFVSGLVKGISDAFAILAANPCVAIALAIALIVAALIMLYNTNENFRNGVNAAWKEIQQIFQNVYNNVIKPIADNIGKIAQDIWKNHIQPLWAQLQIFFGQLSADVKPIVDWLVKVFGPIVVSTFNTVSKVIGDVVGTVIDVVKDVIKIFGGIIDFLAGVFTGDWSKAWKGLQEIFGGIWDLIKDIFSGVIKVIVDLFKGAVDIIKSVWSAIVGFFQTIWAGICAAFKPVKEWFGSTFGAAWEAIKSAWSAVTGWFQNIWDTILKVFKPDLLTKGFTNAWNGIKSVWGAVTGWFQNIWNTIISVFKPNLISDAFSQAWNGIKSGFTGLVNFLIDGMNTVIRAILAPLNGLISGWNDTVGKVTGSIPTISISIPHIPKLATGGLAYSQTLAVVGDNPNAGSNPEVIAPLDKLKSMMGSDNTEVVDTLNSRFDDLICALGELNLSVDLDGRALAKSVNKANRGLGAPILGGAFST